MRSKRPASTGIAGSAPICIPQVQRTFGFATHARQTFAIAWTSFGTIAKSGGGFVFYNTNVLNEHRTASDTMERPAEYERRYGRYAGIPQPWLTGSSLQVEIYPERREVTIRGTYRAANRSAVAIDAIHVATAPDVETGTLSFDRPAARVLVDEDLGHRIYRLETPLQPGDSLLLSFEVHFKPRGFPNRGVDASVFANGTWFTNEDWLPAIGYQPSRELTNPGDRRSHGLAPHPGVPSLYDVAARRHRTNAERIAFDAVVGTAEGQVAVAPGVLRRTWSDGGRRYFRYSTDAPIENRYDFFSADYAVHEEQWSPSALREPQGRPEQSRGATGSGQAVAIQIYHHPGHAATLDRMVASVRASLDHYTRQFGPYPYRYLRLIENPARGMGAHAEATTVDDGERFSLLNPGDGPQDLDLVFAVVAHEVAHQWWGHQVAPARVEGSPLLSESLATYSAMQVVEETLGHEHLRRYLSQLRAEFEIPRTRAAVPLLRATDRFLAYRKGPFALYALSQYIGKERVNEALRRLLEKHGSGAPPLPTTLDFYGELQAVTPVTYQYLLHDLFEANTFWELETKQATAKQTAAGTWQVTLDVQA